MSYERIAGIRQSILEKVIFETISTHSEDAHLHLFQYLRIKGLSEEELDFFRSCWTKVLAGNQAFGRNHHQPQNDQLISNPTLFTQEILLELTKNQQYLQQYEKNLQSLQTITNNLLTLDPQKIRNQVEINNLFIALEKYQSFTEDLQKLIHQFYDLPISFTQRTREETKKELHYLQEFQQSIAKASIKWEKMNIPPNQREIFFEPVEIDRLFEHHYRYGHLSIHIKEKHLPPSSLLSNGTEDVQSLGIAGAATTTLKPKQTVIIPKYFSNDRIIGIEVNADFSSNQEDAFYTFGQFTELSICRYFNPFPKPVNYDYLDDQDGAASSGVLFIYEYPELLPLKDYLLPTGSSSPLLAKEFPNLLRRYPGVMMMWASQLAVASRALYYLPAIYSSPSFALYHDVFITMDGTLLLSGLIFDEITSTPHLLPSQEEFLQQLDYYQDTNQPNPTNLERFTKQIIYPILSNCLATSRIIDYFLPHVYSLKSIGSACNNPHITFYNTVNATTKVNTYPTYYVTTESAITLQIQAGNVRVVKVLPIRAIYGGKKIPSSNEGGGGGGGGGGQVGEETTIQQDENQQQQYYEEQEQYENPPIDFEQEYDVLHVIYMIEEIEKQNYHPEIQCQLLPSASSSSSDDPQILLTVKSLYSCILNIEIIAYLPNRKDLTKSERRWGCIRIEYIAPILSPSTEIQDLIVYLEEYYNYQFLTTIYQSNLFLVAKDRCFDDDVSKNMIMDCVHDWGCILKELKKISATTAYSY